MKLKSIKNDFDVICLFDFLVCVRTKLFVVSNDFMTTHKSSLNSEIDDSQLAKCNYRLVFASLHPSNVSISIQLSRRSAEVNNCAVYLRVLPHVYLHTHSYIYIFCFLSNEYIYRLNYVHSLGRYLIDFTRNFILRIFLSCT